MRSVIYYDFLLFNINDPQNRVPLLGTSEKGQDNSSDHHFLQLYMFQCIPGHQIYNVLSMGITFDFLFPKLLT